MFILTTVVDRIRIPGHMLSLPTKQAVHNEIDTKYPNRILMNFGLVICRYRDCLKISEGLCVPDDGGCHHECLFKLVVFRPFVDEVCVGKIVRSTPEGIQVSLGEFYNDIHIPAYWMLRPSKYDEELKLWVWSPNYSSEQDGDDDTEKSFDKASVKVETGDDFSFNDATSSEKETKKNNGIDDENSEHFEMDLGAEIRFKVKSIHFTRITNTAKGVQATITTTAHSQELPLSGAGIEQEDGKCSDKPRSLRKRSLSVEISDVSNLPSSMNIIASICEDGLGLTSWWTSLGEEEGEEVEE